MKTPSLEVSHAVRRRIGRGFAITSVTFSLLGLVILAALWGWDPLVRTDAIYFGALGVGFGTLTWILVTARSDNGAVWAVAWSALFSSLFTAGLAMAVLLSRGTFPGLTLDELRELSPAMLPLPAAIALHFRFWAVVPALWLALTFGLLLFPDGRLPTRRWRWVGWLSIIAIAVSTLATAVVQHPRSSLAVKAAEGSIDSGVGPLIDIGFFLSSIAALLSIASLAVRYRRSTGVVRDQIRWIGFGGAAFIIVITASASLENAVGAGIWADLLGLSMFFLLVVSWGVAITKYRLYEIDVVVSKSVTYVGLVAAITALYSVVVVVPLLVVGESDDGGPGLVLPIVATGVVALLFEPIRKRMQRWADRLVYGDRASPHQVLSQVTARLSGGSGSDGIDDLARMVAAGTGADRAVVWMRSGETLLAEGIWPRDGLGSGMPLMTVGFDVDEYTEMVAVRHEDVDLGALSITKPHNDPVTAADRELLADVAAGAALVLRNMRLNKELEERANDVRESRRRLIAAQDAERHRLERDLHDGAQQQVVALKVKLGIAKTLAQREGADEIATRVIALADETQHAVDALRAVAHGIYPPLLESEGLGPALRAVERTSALPVELVVADLERYARPAEETAYFCVIETLEKARMSGAASARVDLATRNGDLVTEIGLGRIETDLDLRAVADRIDAAGGTLTVEDQADRGRFMISSLPVTYLEGSKL